MPTIDIAPPWSGNVRLVVVSTDGQDMYSIPLGANGEAIIFDSTVPGGIRGGSAGGQAFPVGSVFIAAVSTNPATLLGYGTWSAFGTGRVLVGLDSGDTDFDTIEETGGGKTHVLTPNEIP